MSLSTQRSEFLVEQNLGNRRECHEGQKQTKTKQLRKSLIILLNSLWKVAGVLSSLKGKTKYSKRPNGVLKAVFHSSPSFMRKR